MSLSDQHNSDHHEAIQQLRALLQGEEDLYVGNPADEQHLLMYLHFTDYDADKAFEKMKSVYRHKAENSTFYASKRDPDFQDAILIRGTQQMMDYRDQLGRRIYVIKLSKMDPQAHRPPQMSQTDDLWAILAMDERETQLNGLVLIIDLAGLPWSSARYLSPSEMRIGSDKRENRPVKHVQYHLINGGMLINAFMTLMQPFLSQQTKEQMFYHKNYESLHKHIPPKFLPADYGGERPAVDCEQLIHDFIDSRVTRLNELLSYGYPPRKKD